MSMRVEEILHMVGGAGETSYASNSKFQVVPLELFPVLDDAIGGVYKSLHPVKMVVADLGCSSGPNTFVVMSEVLDVVSDLRRSLQERQEPPEIQFFLNDLPGNDFNHVFRCLGEYKRKVEQEKGICWCPTTWWECRAPSTAGFSHVGASTSSIVLDLSTGSLRFLKDSTPNGVPHSTTRTSTLQRQAHRRL
ncbi:unnamed protein product [Musa acuminata var. zebrina]